MLFFVANPTTGGAIGNFVRRYRIDVRWIGVGLVLHIGIALTMSIGIFPYGVME